MPMQRVDPEYGPVTLDRFLTAIRLLNQKAGQTKNHLSIRDLELMRFLLDDRVSTYLENLLCRDLKQIQGVYIQWLERMVLSYFGCCYDPWPQASLIESVFEKFCGNRPILQSVLREHNGSARAVLTEARETAALTEALA